MLLLLLILLGNSLKGFSGAEHETLCTSNACFTLHLEKVKFEKASHNCYHNGGYLMTVRNRDEEDVLRSLLSLMQGQHQEKGSTIWIGLKLHRGDCVLANRALRGFKWTSGERDSHYSNWAKEPVETCTERCVSVDYNSSGSNPLKWTTVPCKTKTFYACKFFFKGMCKALSKRGRGLITYTAPFSEEPLRRDMDSLPLGTYARIVCGDQQPLFSVCMGLDNEHRWTVPGPFCQTDNEKCAVNNGGCEQLCHQDLEKIRCFCKDGYDLQEDGFSCRETDVCSTCEHQCVRDVSGFSCKCPDGFKLAANQRNCSDIDECQSHCKDHICLNTHGSYRCECNVGYEMVDGQCRDVDECTRPRCEHSCLNTAGSFSCSCQEGFALSEDRLTCVDVNECDGDLCQFNCINTVGSFWCACPPGFRLDTAGTTCAPDATATSRSDVADEESHDNFTESSLRATAESAHTDAPLPELVNVTQGDAQSNVSMTMSQANAASARMIICVLGSVIPLLILISVTLAIAIYRCSQSKKEAKKTTSTDGYCWVSSGLDPRLEKLYESILTDDL
ncbi:uncharacterized protein cd93 [Aulostomus maculatus]